MKFFIAVLLASSCFAQDSRPLAAGLEWPCFRGPAGNGVAASAKPPLQWSTDKHLALRVEMPGGGASSPIIHGNHVYLTCYSGYGVHEEQQGDKAALQHHLLCLDRQSGKVLWQRDVPGPLAKAAAKVQIQEHGFATPTPVADRHQVYVYFGKPGIVAFRHDGKKAWQSGLGVPSKDAKPRTNAVIRQGKALPLRWGAAASPIRFANLVIVNASEESNSIRALDTKDGSLVWKRESANLEGSATTPVVVGAGKEAVLVISLGGEVWGLDPLDGKELWRIETGTRAGMSPTPVVSQKLGLVFVFGGMGKGHAIRYARNLAPPPTCSRPDTNLPYRVAWRGANLGIPSPILHDGKLILINAEGMVTLVDAASGKQLLKQRLPKRTTKLYASPLLADGRIYVVSRKRGTYVFANDKDFSFLAHNELGDKSDFYASPVAVGRELWLRSDRFLYCLRRK